MASLTDDEKEEIELAVDLAFLKMCGRTYRKDEPRPPSTEQEESPPPTDSLDKIAADFPALFGTTSRDDAP
jgi:hypothetical protein